MVDAAGQRSVVELEATTEWTEEEVEEIEELTELVTSALGTVIEDGCQSAQVGEADVAGVMLSPATSVGTVHVETVSDTTMVVVEVFHSIKVTVAPPKSPSVGEEKIGVGSHFQYSTGGWL